MSNPMAAKIKHLEKQIQEIVQKAPRAIGTMAASHFRDNFAKEGFDDVGVRKWAARKRNGTKDQGRAILTKTGRLKRSVRLRRATTTEVRIGTNVPYARYHNEGGIIHRKPHGRKTGVFHVATRKEKKKQVRRSDFRIHRRQFIGSSASLNKRIDGWYEKRLNAAIRSMKSIK